MTAGESGEKFKNAFLAPLEILAFLIPDIKLIHFTYQRNLRYLFVPGAHAFIAQRPRIHLIHLQRQKNETRQNRRVSRILSVRFPGKLLPFRW
jgi:hypothetical protein